MKKIRLEILGLSYSQSQSGAYALILGVVGEKRRLPIIIGGFEAQAIAIELEKMKPTRPLTHDLFTNFANHYRIRVTEIIINKFDEGIFFAQLVCEHNGEISNIDSRTSDAVALAIRFKCPIYTYESIIDEAGIEMDDDDKKEETKGSSKTALHGTGETKYDEMLIDELEELLKTAVAEENYEEASRLRDEISKRKRENQ